MRVLARDPCRPRLADRDPGRAGRQAFHPTLGAAPRRQPGAARCQRRPAAERASAPRRLIRARQPTRMWCHGAFLAPIRVCDQALEDFNCRRSVSKRLGGDADAAPKLEPPEGGFLARGRWRSNLAFDLKALFGESYPSI